MADFPIFKLGFLLLKQLSVPIANVVAQTATKYYFFRTYVCMPPAYFLKWLEVRTKYYYMTPEELRIKQPPINEHAAIDIGAQILGEVIVFVVAATTIVGEIKRQKAYDAKANIYRAVTLDIISQSFERLDRVCAKHERAVRKLGKIIKQHEVKHPILEPSSEEPIVESEIDDSEVDMSTERQVLQDRMDQIEHLEDLLLHGQ